MNDLPWRFVPFAALCLCLTAGIAVGILIIEGRAEWPGRTDHDT